jgi:hypothetical protein
MMRIGIRTRLARTPVAPAPPSREGSTERPTLPVDRELGEGSHPEDLVLTGVGESYRPRHAADATEGQLDWSEGPGNLRMGRHRG